MAHIFATTDPEISPREQRNMIRAKKVAAQGMVLLHNTGVLPLKANGQKLAVFGSGVRRTVKGGTGSGDVNSRSVYNVEQGLCEVGYDIVSTAWLDRYDASCEAHLQEHMQRFMTMFSEKGQEAILDALQNPYRDPDVPRIEPEDFEGADRDYAIYVVARTSGEGSDRRVIEGDYTLSAGERQNLEILTASFKTVIVVLNTGAVMDTEWLRSNPKIGAILLMSQLGNISGLALAELLVGKTTPSGRLTATWAKRYEDYPCAESFGHRNGDISDEYYHEGIFVGYRYFDSFSVTPAYPFGFGLSYTSFKVITERVSLSGSDVCVQVRVRNIGDTYTGRETVQVYVSAPAGNLPKPYQELAGFAKTCELLPGQEECLKISFPITQLASYDEEKAAWVLEKGAYYVRVGTHSRATHIAAALWLDTAVITEQLENKLKADCVLTPWVPPVPQEEFYPGEAREKAEALRLDVIAATIPVKKAQYRKELKELTPQTDVPVTMQQVAEGKATLEELTAQLTAEELIQLCVGTARGGFGSASVIGAASDACPGAAGDTTSALLESRGVSNLILADGPAGLRLSRSFVADSQGNVIPGLGESAMGGLEKLLGAPVPERPADAVDYYQYCTAIPIATALAQTWDMDLLREAGDIVGGEMEEFGVALWLAPGMNIQRNPLCGRNFEYYSEDPILSGLCAAAETEGVQAHPGCGTTIKHFAMNNLEDNRSHNNSHCGERAIREIYLKGFQIAVQKSSPMALMTSYNLLNGLHTANHYELLTSVLRDEWGFNGLVMTDWGTTGGGDLNPAMDVKYGASDPAGCIRAGNDLIMPGSQQDVDALAAALEQGKLTKAELQICAMRVLALVKHRQMSRKEVK